MGNMEGFLFTGVNSKGCHLRSMSVFERFVVLMYDLPRDIMEVNEARIHVFSHMTRPLENIPPTKAVPKPHIKHAC